MFLRITHKVNYYFHILGCNTIALFCAHMNLVDKLDITQKVRKKGMRRHGTVVRTVAGKARESQTFLDIFSSSFTPQLGFNLDPGTETEL